MYKLSRKFLLSSIMTELFVYFILFHCIFVHCEYTGNLTNLSGKSSTTQWQPIHKTSTRWADECCETRPKVMGIMGCNLNELHLAYGHCMTWDNATQTAEVGRCPFIHRYNHTCNPSQYSIPRNSSGSELNHLLITGRMSTVGTALMALDQQYFMMTFLVLIALTTDTTGFLSSSFS